MNTLQIFLWILPGVLMVPAASPADTAAAGSPDVGIWYCTYYPKDWDYVIGYKNAHTYLPLCPDGYRHYASDEVAVIDEHLRQLAEARINFLALELSPGALGGYRMQDMYTYMVHCGRLTCERIKAWNDTHAWKIRYCLGVGVHRDVRGEDSWGTAIEKVAKDVFKTFYENRDYGGPENYYHLNGLPLMICYGLRLAELHSEWENYKGPKTYGDRFTLRTYTGYAAAGEYGWPLPLHQGTILHPEIELVQPGFNVHRPGEVEPRSGGDFYRACWQKVLDNPKPQIVMIQAFNDYLEESAVWPTDTGKLNATQEKWTGHDGELHPSMYWEMTKEYIAQLRDAKR